jgi:hypothetical protein
VLLISGVTGDAGVIAGAGGSGPDASITPDGKSIFFNTRAALSPRDVNNGGEDIYAARVGGGFPLETGGAVCDVLADGCGAGAGADVLAPTRATGDSSGANAPAVARLRLSVGGLSVAQRRRAARRGVLALRVRSSGGGLVRVTAHGRLGGRVRRVGAASRRFSGAGAATLRVSLNRQSRKVLADRGRLVVKLSVRASGARPQSRRVVLVGANR